MLKEHLKEGTKLRLFHPEQILDGLVFDGECQVCEGTLSGRISDTQIEMILPASAEETLLYKRFIYLLYLYPGHKVYRCSVCFHSEYGNDSGRVLCLEIASHLEIVQRRMHQRVSSHARISWQPFKDERQAELLKKGKQVLVSQMGTGDLSAITFSENMPVYEESLVDISGGGIRFISRHSIKVGKVILAGFALFDDKNTAKITVLGQVVSAGLLRNEPDNYDIRVKYLALSEQERERIVRFVFQLERDMLK